jgi:hypothetical protein
MITFSSPDFKNRSSKPISWSGQARGTALPDLTVPRSDYAPGYFRALFLCDDNRFYP